MMQLSQYPECEHRHEGRKSCLHATAMIGIERRVSPAFCAHTCAAWKGPRAEQPDDSEWGVRNLRMHFNAYSSAAWTDKVLRKFIDPVDIIAPDRWIGPAQELAAKLRRTMPGFQRVCLTGSVIARFNGERVDGMPDDADPKDVDVSIVVRSLRDVYDDLDDYLPEMLDGVKADYFVVERPSGFSVNLDVDTLELFVSVDVKFGTVDPRLTIVKTTGRWAALDREIREHVESIRGGASEQTIAGKALHAARSIARTSMGLDRAPREQVAARMAVCQACPHRAGWRCRECGCALRMKARDINERCPIGEWPDA